MGGKGLSGNIGNCGGIGGGVRPGTAEDLMTTATTMSLFEPQQQMNGFQVCHSLGGGTGSGMGMLLISRLCCVIKWMLSKGQGNTMGMYGQLIRALDMVHRAAFWTKKIGRDLHSVPWQLCNVMISIYYRNNMLENLIKGLVCYLFCYPSEFYTEHFSLGFCGWLCCFLGSFLLQGSIMAYEFALPVAITDGVGPCAIFSAILAALEL